MFTTHACVNISKAINSCLSFEREIRHPNGAFDNLWIFYQDIQTVGRETLARGSFLETRNLPDNKTYEKIKNLMEQFTVETGGDRELVGDLVEGMLRGRFSKKKINETSWATWMERNRNLSMNDYEVLIAYFVYTNLE